MNGRQGGSPPPKRVRVGIIGHGIGAAAVFLDLASRGWRDCVYLKVPRSEGFAPPLMLASHATLVDPGVPPRRKTAFSQWQLLKNVGASLAQSVPVQVLDRFGKKSELEAFLLEEARVEQKMTQEALKFGASCVPVGCIESLVADENGWIARYRDAEEKEKSISCLFVVNLLGPKMKDLFVRSGLSESVVTGRVDEVWAECGSLDSREIQYIPLRWRMNQGYWLHPLADGRALAGPFFRSGEASLPETQEAVKRKLAAVSKGRYTPSRFQTREHLLVIDSDPYSAGFRPAAKTVEYSSNARGCMFAVYGAHRYGFLNFAQQMGDRLTSRFGEWRPSRLMDPEIWA